MQDMILKVAPPYDEKMIKDIQTGFEKLLGHPIELKVEDDESLVGGFCAYIDGKVYDASMKTRLLDMRQNLA